MEPTSELLLKNAGRLSDSILLINPGSDGLMPALPESVDADWFSQDYATAGRLADQEEVIRRFGSLPSQQQLSHRHLVLYLPREKARLGLLCKALAARGQPGQLLWLVGHNRAGIKSAPRILKRFFDSVTKLDAARHCVIWQARLREEAAADPDLDEEFRWFSHQFMDTELQLAWLPGMFARDGIDEASELLLETLPDRFNQYGSGQVLDVGCGTGLLGAASSIAAQAAGNPLKHLLLCDSYALSLEAAKKTLAHNALSGKVIASDVFSQVEGKYDLIVSNPPFHQGVDQDLSVPKRLIVESPAYLFDQGKLLIVANRHLPYRNLMQKIFRQVELVTENRSFVVLEATKPVSTPS